MLNAFFATLKKVFSFTGTFGSYVNTGTTATSNTVVAVGAGNVTFTGDSSNVGGTCQYKINAGAFTNITNGANVAIANGDNVSVRITGMNTSGDGSIVMNYSGTSLSYPVTKL